MRLRLTLCWMGSPVSWLAKSRISSTERKSSLACALVMRVCGSGCSADGDGVLPCCWFCTATPAPGTCVAPGGFGVWAWVWGAAGWEGVAAWFGDCAGGFDCGWLGVAWAHDKPISSSTRKIAEKGDVRSWNDLARGNRFLGMAEALRIQGHLGPE